jgi:FkbM family methyltransferase
VRRFIPHENETTLFAFLRDHIQPGDLVFDIGSFLGIYAMLAARAAGRHGRVLAFEPTTWSHGVLNDHVRMNALDDRIQTRNAAVGAQRVRRPLVTFEGEPYRNMIATANDESGNGPSVEVLSVDEVCEAIGRAPDWIRMDVQGMEFDVLRGAARLLHESGRRVRIVAEMHPTEWPKYGITPKEAPALLADLGLRARSLDGQDPFAVETHALLEPI